MLFENSVLIYLAIIVICYFLWNYRRVFFIRRLDTLPGPKTWPFIGNCHMLLGCEEFLDIILKMTEDYSSPFQFWLGSKLFIGIYEPDDVKTILQSKNCIDKSMLYKVVPLLGMGLITAPESIWTRMRKLTAPTFSSMMLRNFFNIFVEQSAIFTHQLEKDDLSGNEIILQEQISHCAWRIACDSMMGIKLESNKNNDYLKAVKRSKNILSHRIRNTSLFSDVIFNLTALGGKQKEDTNLVYSLTDEMIQQRIRKLNNPDILEDENNQIYRTCFDILMEASPKENFTSEQIRDIVITMLLAEKVLEELLEIYGTETIKSVPIKYDDLQKMHYLDRVIKETMRIFPVVPVIGRQAKEDLKIGEVILPKGTNIFIPIIKMHRNEKYWPNPLMFDPDRFLPERIKSQSYYYTAFSDGPRNCIGMKYAMMSMKVVLATLARTFVFKVNKSVKIDEIKLKFSTTISTEKPLKVKLEKRYFQ